MALALLLGGRFWLSVGPVEKLIVTARSGCSGRTGAAAAAAPHPAARPERQGACALGPDAQLLFVLLTLNLNRLTKPVD